MPRKRFDLDRFRDDHALLTIRRAKIDDHQIQGFVLAHSPALVAFRKIRDFVDDGYLVVPRRDITSAKRSKTDVFQQQMLAAEGVLDSIDFDERPPVASLAEYLQSLPKGELVILEGEYDADENGFLLGRLVAADTDTVSVRWVSGAATWDEQPTTWRLDRISSVQVRSTYLNAYTREFARHPERDFHER